MPDETDTRDTARSDSGRWFYSYVADVALLAGTARLDERLDEGWEPFAVTEDRDGSITVHLRMGGP